jgi:glycosyltransferase involved in cell wall biosynthesis
METMQSDYGDRDVDIVPNAVDRKQFFADIRSKQAIPVVGFLSSSAKFKGVDVTVRAIELLRDKIPNLKIISFGSHAPIAGSFANLAVDFYLLPPQDEIRNIYTRCDVWLTASRSEGFNLPAMEAMACRTPVVSTRTGWPEEAILSGVNGYLVDIDDASGLAKAAENVLKLTNDEWTTMSQKAFDTVSKSSWESSANLFEMALSSACARL